jgi:hypothetical protein
MRLRLAAVVLAAWPVIAEAQVSVSQPAIVPLPAIGLPFPSIGLPLPQIGLPLPQIGLPLPQLGPLSAPDPWRRGTANPPNDAQRRFGPREHRRKGGGMIYLVPVYGWPFLYLPPQAAASPVASPESRPEETKPALGRLRLVITPDTELQFFVDGYYVGTSVDLDGELKLAPGPHMIEIRAAGYETLVVDVNIAANRSITYRASLRAADARAEAEPPAAPAGGVPVETPMTGYVIPGCYVGNVPPEEANLPSTCDASRVITIRQ